MLHPNLRGIIRIETAREGYALAREVPAMWSCKTEVLNGGRTTRFVPLRDRSTIRYAEVLDLWQTDEAFCSVFLSLLIDSNYSAYRWETPPITTATANREFEFVLIETPALACTADPTAFAEQFRAAEPKSSVVVFANLGKDATMVVPCPIADASAYGHLAAFVRSAPESQRHELWRVVGAIMCDRLSREPVWLSTAGMGVAWLHVRLDSRPKYYGFADYRERPRLV